MPDKLLNQIANDPAKALTVQAGLTGFLGILIAHFTSLTPAETTATASFLSGCIVWVGRRRINRMDADEAVQEPLRAMVLLRDKTELEALAMDDNDPRKPQRMRQAEALTEQIFLGTVEKNFLPVSKKEIGKPVQPPLLESPNADDLQ